MTTWNPIDNSDATLSGGDLVATFQTTVSTWHSVRSTNSPAKTSGQYHAEVTMTSVDADGGWLFGVADSSATLTSYCGSDTHGIGCQAYNFSGGQLLVWLNGAFTTYNAVMNAGNVIAVEVDVPNKLVWFQNVTTATGWTDGAGGFTGNPAAGTGGTSFASISTGGGLMLMGSGYFGSGIADTLTLNPGPTFVGTVSSGFSSWDDSLMGAMVI